MQASCFLQDKCNRIMQSCFIHDNHCHWTIVATVFCVLRRASADPGPSAATGLAAETILEDEPEEDAAPTPEQLEVCMH